jgi:hypothetical protein
MVLGGGTMKNDANYFSRRAGEERVAAMQAAHPKARSAHLQMAERYAVRANAIASHELLFGADLVAS